MKTYVAKPGKIKQQWWLFDAEGQVAGRLAAEIATSRLGGVRGGVLDDVVVAYPAAWRQIEQPAELPIDLLAVLR